LKKRQSNFARAAWIFYIIAVWLCIEAVTFLLGFGAVAVFASRPGTETTAYVILGSALLFPPAVFWLIRTGRKRRRVFDSCAHCGYSLAGLAADAPCPECGKGAATT
jgi:hypothetical protein